MQGTIRQVGDTYYGDNARPLPPPTPETVIAYLQNVPPAVDEAQAEAVATAGGIDPHGLIRLWQQDFHAHPPGETTAQGLYEAVQAQFEHSRRLGRIERVVILADTGMGKTPSLIHLRAGQATRTRAALTTWQEQAAANGQPTGDLAATAGFVVPLIVNLGYLAEGSSPESLLADAFNELLAAGDADDTVEPIRPGQIPSFLQTYRCLLLLDGLDYLISNREGGGLGRLRHFMELHRHEQHQYTLTCRTTSYREQLGTAATLLLDDLADAQVKAVLQDAYSLLTPSLRELVRNRAMLGLVLEMPETQAALAGTEPRQAATHVSRLQNKGHLLTWQMDNRLQNIEPSPGEPPLPLLEGVVAQLAYAMHRDHTFTYPEQQVMEVVDDYLKAWRETTPWRAVLDALVRRSLVERDDGRGWRFCRARDQSFWAARAIFTHPERVHPLLDEANDYWWREALDILVGLVPDPTAFFFTLMDRYPLAAASCLQNAGPSVAGRVTDAVIDALVEAMAQESSYRRKQIVERIVESHHPRTLEVLFLALHREWSSLPLKALAQALSVGAQSGDQPDRPLHARLEQAEALALNRVRSQPHPVADLVGTYTHTLAGPADHRVTKEEAAAAMAHRLADRAEPAKRRGLSAIYLGLLATGEDPSVWEPLVENFRTPHEDNFVAWCVVQALTECPLSAVEEWALRLCTHATYRQSKWQHRRARAVYLLGWISNPENTSAVLEEALHDQNPLVRGFAVDALARLNHPDARDRIHTLLSRRGDPETDPDVLRRMAEALGQIGTVESIPYLQAHLQHERVRTRRAMQKAIADIRQRYGLWEPPLRPNYWT